MARKRSRSTRSFPAVKTGISPASGDEGAGPLCQIESGDSILLKSSRYLSVTFALSEYIAICTSVLTSSLRSDPIREYRLGAPGRSCAHARGTLR